MDKQTKAEIDKEIDKGMGTVISDQQGLLTKGTPKRVDVDAICIDDDNPRTESSVRENAKRIVDSYRQRGYLSDQPLVVEPFGTLGEAYRVIRGNCRLTGAKLLAESDPAVFAEVFPSGKIPVLILKDLDSKQRTLLAIDHATELDRQSLTEWEYFQAVKRLVLEGYKSQAGIAAHLGLYNTKKDGTRVPNRSWVQQRVNLAKMPQFVQEEYRVYCDEGKAKTAFRISKIASLYTLFVECGRDGQHEAFQAAWQECLTTTTDKAKKSSALSAARVAELAGTIDKANPVRQALDAAIGETPPTCINAAATLANRLLRDSELLSAVQFVLGADWPSIEKQAIEHMQPMPEEVTA